MNRRQLITLVGGTAVWPLAARAQHDSLPVIGLLNSGSPRAFDKFIAAFHQGLGTQGYIEGRDLRIDYRWAAGRYDDLGKLAAELVRGGISVLAATGGVASARAAIKSTTTIPVVFVVGFDPVQLGLVASIGRPGGNVTGASVYTTELASKRLELLVELAPDVRKVAMLVNPGSVLTELEVKETFAAARSELIGRDLLVIKASNESEIDAAFAAAAEQNVGGVLVTADPLFTARRVQLVALAARHKIAAMYPWREYVDAGGLVSYGTELTWAYRQIGTYAGQILKGVPPSDLPVVLPTKYDLIINLKTAKALGLHVSTDLLVLADETVE